MSDISTPPSTGSHAYSVAYPQGTGALATPTQTTPIQERRQGSGAGVGAGTSAPTSLGAGLGAGASLADLESYVRKTYGYLAAFLDIPDVRDVLLNGARNGWGVDELYGALSQTHWWQTTSASARQWAQLMAEDPATAQAQVQTSAANINDTAKQFGLSLSGDQIGQLAMQAAQFGWTNQQTIDALLKNVTYGQVSGGAITADADAVKATAGNYLVNVSDSTAGDWALRIARGELTMDGVTSMLQQQAKARWGFMAQSIDAGTTPKDYFAPVRDAIASTLEVAPDSIDLMSPKWAGMIEKPDKGGGVRAATISEAMLSARQDPGWAKTRNAQDQMANMVGGLATAFGQAR